MTALNSARKARDRTHAPPREESARPAPRLYLITPPEPVALAGPLTAALGAGDVAAVLVRLAPADERSLVQRVKALAPLVQAQGAALLIDGWPEIVARAGADGLHARGLAALKEALRLKPERIVGAGALRTRHDAMLASEWGADYVMLGEPDETGRRPPFEAVVELVAWWAELFEIPCVGYAQTVEELDELCAAGADFIAAEAALSDPQSWAAALARARARLGRSR